MTADQRRAGLADLTRLDEEMRAPAEGDGQQLTEAERDFVGLVRIYPGRKLNSGEAEGPNGEPLWKRPESLGLIKCVGSYKWVPADAAKADVQPKGTREAALHEAANVVAAQMKRWPTDDRAVYIAGECAAAVRALIGAAPSPAPVAESSGARLALCPFCGRRPVLTVRPDNAEATSYFAAVACFCDGYAACAHKDATAAEADEAERLVREKWNRRATASPAVGADHAAVVEAARAVMARHEREISGRICSEWKELAALRTALSKPPVQPMGDGNA